MIAGIFEHHDLAGLERVNCCCNFVAYTVIDEYDLEVIGLLDVRDDL